MMVLIVLKEKSTQMNSILLIKVFFCNLETMVSSSFSFLLVCLEFFLQLALICVLSSGLFSCFTFLRL